MKKKLGLLLLLASSLISADLSRIKTIKTSFVQRIKNSSNNTITYKGSMLAKREKNLALWVYSSPVEKKIYYRDGNIVILEPELEQVTFAKLDQVPNILTLLKRAKKIAKNKFVTKFKSTRYTITTNSKNIEKIEYTDQMRNRVSISFINPRVNIPISNDSFIYEIPAGYDVLKQ